MSVIQVPDELQRVIDRQVAEGRAISPAEFLREAVMRLVDATDAELDAIQQVVEGGSADIDAGRYTVVATAADERRLHDGITARLQSQFATDR